MKSYTFLSMQKMHILAIPNGKNLKKDSIISMPL